MAIFMLNLIHDWNDPMGNSYGRFNEYPTTAPAPGTNPLSLSKCWLTATSDEPDPNKSEDRTLVGNDKTKLTAAVGDQFQVRVTGLNTPPNSVGRITVLVSRNDHGNAPQPWASPFALAGAPCGVYDTVDPNGTPLTAPGPSGAWLMPLSAIASGFVQKGPNKFSLMVAATICQSNWTDLKTYSHDPDMEVDI